MKPYKSISSSHTLAMEGSSSAQSRLIHSNPFPLSSLGSSSSPPIQNASTVTPQEGELPGKDTVAMEGWSLLDFNKPQLGCTGSSSFSSTTQNDNGATNQQCDLLGKGLKRKRSSGGVVPNDNGRPVPRNNEEENHYAGISTELVLYEDKCKIKKKLKKSDLSDHLSRLMLSRGSVEAHVLPLMDEQMKERVKSKDGMKVVVRNADTREEHELVFRRWGPSGSYVLNCGWNKLFVKGRGLEVGDQIGMFWDTDDSKFHFTVHRKVACGPSNAVA